MKMRLFAFWLVSCLVTAACSSGTYLTAYTPTKTTTQTSETTVFQVPSNYSTYTDEVGLFKISYPPGWTPDLSFINSAAAKDIINRIVSKYGEFEGSVIFMSGVLVNNGYRPNLNIIVDPMPEGYTYDRYLTANINGLKSFMQNDYREISRINTIVDGRKATIVEYEGTYQDASLSSIGKIHNLVMLTVANKTAWSVTCTSFDNSFSQWSSDFNNIVRSLRILR